MIYYYLRRYVFILVCITRWGTQISMIKSILRIEEVLRDYSHDEHVKLPKSPEIIDIMILRVFWI